MSDTRTLREKLEAMAGQVTQSPNEASIAAAMLELQGPPAPPRQPPVVAAAAGWSPDPMDPRWTSVTFSDGSSGFAYSSTVNTSFERVVWPDQTE